MKIAMWSGPRNISTAMMRSFGSRKDCFVSDEPLYAHFLAVTGKDHPGRDEVIAHHESDWRKVAAALTGPIPTGKTLWYQKHMSHHLLPGIDRGWLDALTHAFLIREPAAMLASLAEKLESPALEDTGLPQQVELFRSTRARTGATPPVVDARDVLADPRRTLGLLCDALRIAFDDAMLRWEKGRRATDGIWAKHWYQSVEASEGFQPLREGGKRVPDPLRGVLAGCEPLYEELHAHRIH